MTGATAHLTSGTIDVDDFARIKEIVEKADLSEFRPLIYLIPSDKINSKLKLVPVSDSANPLSTEYLICDLKKDEFDVIEPNRF